jgi:hypothetical protein
MAIVARDQGSPRGNLGEGHLTNSERLIQYGVASPAVSALLSPADVQGLIWDLGQPGRLFVNLVE